MIITKEALFVEGSGVNPDYSAEFEIPADAVFQEVRVFFLSQWDDTGSPSIHAAFSGASDLLNDNVKTAQVGSTSPSGPGSDGNIDHGAQSPNPRSFFVTVVGGNDDGSAGVTRVRVVYSIDDPILVPVDRV